MSGHREFVGNWTFQCIFCFQLFVLLPLFCVVGYGVFVTKPVRKGNFLAEYCGDLISYDEGDSVDDQTYLYYFAVKSNKYW